MGDGITRIAILKAISKIKIDDNDRDILYSWLNNYQDDLNIISDIYKNKLQFLLLKHLIEMKCCLGMNKSLGLQLSAQFAFLQNKYSTYLSTANSISKLFNENNIPHCILKGISIINDLYTSNELIYRDFNDVDFLVSPSKTKLAKKLLENINVIQGTVTEDMQILPASRKEIIFWSLNSHQEHRYIAESPFSHFSPWLFQLIDINTTIFEGGKSVPQISTDYLLEHRINKHIKNDILIFSLRPEYEFIQLCYHFYKDTKYDIKKANNENFCLQKFCDIREFILHFGKEIDWTEFVKIVNEFNIGDQIYYSLYIVSSFYGDLGIEEILKEIKTTHLFSIGFLDWKRMLL